VLGKYAAQAHEISESVPASVKCHMLRHSKAIHLLQAGVNLIYIRDFLRHTDIKTTEVYARADTELKRKALENAYPDLVDSDLPDWNNNTDLMSWLLVIKPVSLQITMQSESDRNAVVSSLSCIYFA